jgi:hypothetical protein
MPQLHQTVIFDSLLFHKTTPHHFRAAGFAGKRINLTLLFGDADESRKLLQQQQQHSQEQEWQHQGEQNNQNKEEGMRRPQLEQQQAGDALDSPAHDDSLLQSSERSVASLVHAEFANVAEEEAALQQMNPRPAVARSGYFHSHGSGATASGGAAEDDGAATSGYLSNRNDTHERCRGAVLVSGQFRTFSEPAVRDAFRSNLLGGLSGKHRVDVSSKHRHNEQQSSSEKNADALDESGDGNEAQWRCDLDLYFCPKPYDSVSSNRNEWFARSSAMPSATAHVEAVLRSEFPEARVVNIISHDPPPPPSLPHFADIASVNFEKGKVPLPLSGEKHQRVARSIPGFSNNAGSCAPSSPGKGAEVPRNDSQEIRSFLPPTSAAWLTLRAVQGCYEGMLAENTRRSTTAAPSAFRRGSPGAALAPSTSTISHYDWFIHARFDLGYAAPFPPLPTLHPGAIHAPYTSMPVSDTFAVVPAALARHYFNAADLCSACDAALYCGNLDGNISGVDGRRGLAPDVGMTEVTLVQHVLAPHPAIEHSGKSISTKGTGRRPGGSPISSAMQQISLPHARGVFHLQDFPLSIVRGVSGSGSRNGSGQDSSCQSIAGGKIPCILLTNAGFSGAGVSDFGQCERMVSLAYAARCDRIFRDEGRGIMLRQLRSFTDATPTVPAFDREESTVADLEKSMLRFALEHPSFPNGSVALPVAHTIKLTSAHAPSSVGSGGSYDKARLHLNLIFEQHAQATHLLRETLACLFLNHLYFARRDLLPDRLVAKIPKGLATCFGPASDEYSQRRLFEWSTDAWGSLSSFELAQE